MGKRVILVQTPAFLFEVIPAFYNEANKFGFFDKFYIVTDYKGEANLGSNCQLIRLKKDLQFSSNMLHALKYVEEDIFLVCCDDHIFTDKNDVNRWEHYFNYFESHQDMGFLRLSNTKHKVMPQEKDEDRDVFPISTKYRYYISLQPSLWRRGYFELTLNPGLDAWDYERRGAKTTRRAVRNRESKNMRSYCVRDNVIERTNFYKDGKHYRRQFVDYAVANNIVLDRKKSVLDRGKKYSYDEYIKRY